MPSLVWLLIPLWLPQLAGRHHLRSLEVLLLLRWTLQRLQQRPGEGHHGVAGQPLEHGGEGAAGMGRLLATCVLLCGI